MVYSADYVCPFAIHIGSKGVFRLGLVLVPIIIDQSRYIFSIQLIKSLFTVLVYSTDYVCPFAIHMMVIFHFLLQLRVHRTTCSTVCVHVTSSGIIEDCSDMLFAPYNFSYEGIEEHCKVWGLLHTNA